MSNSSIWAIDMTLSGATTPEQSGPGRNGNEGVLWIPQRLFSGHSLGEGSYPSAVTELPG